MTVFQWTRLVPGLVYPAESARQTAHTPRLIPPPPDHPRWVKPLGNHRAFTLIEIIVVVALISIMLMVAIPRLDGGLFSDGSDETARWLIAAVRQLKQKAVAEQKTYLLNVSPDIQRIWISAADLAETEADAARDSGYQLPRSINIDHVALTNDQRISSGTIPVGFYPQGYSDKAVIRMRTRDGDRLAFIIEPFLSQVDLIRGSQGW